MRSRVCAAFAFPIAIGAALVAPGARAETPTDGKAAAEELFVRAKGLVATKDYAQACPMFAESLRLDPGLGVMLHLAACYERAGKPASAWAQFREAEQVATRERDARADVARRRADALEPNLFRLTIVVPRAAEVDGLAIERDGIFVDRPQWGAAVPIDPGAHEIIATAPNKARFETAITVPVGKGERSITIPPLADAPRSETAAARPSGAEGDSVQPSGSGTPSDARGTAIDGAAATPAEGRGRTQRVAAIAVAGAGVAVVALGGYFGLRASARLSDSNADGHCRPDNHCDATGTDLRHDAQSAGNVSTVLFAAGLAAVAGGAVLYFTAPSRTRTASRPARAATSPTIAPALGLRSAGAEVRVSF